MLSAKNVANNKNWVKSLTVDGFLDFLGTGGGASNGGFDEVCLKLGTDLSPNGRLVCPINGGIFRGGIAGCPVVCIGSGAGALLSIFDVSCKYIPFFNIKTFLSSDDVII